eukprot:4684094-Prymnesium_polylepis.1
MEFSQLSALGWICFVFGISILFFGLYLLAPVDAAPEGSRVHPDSESSTTTCASPPRPGDASPNGSMNKKQQFVDPLAVSVDRLPPASPIAIVEVKANRIDRVDPAATPPPCAVVLNGGRTSPTADPSVGGFSLVGAPARVHTPIQEEVDSSERPEEARAVGRVLPAARVGGRAPWREEWRPPAPPVCSSEDGRRAALGGPPSRRHAASRRPSLPWRAAWRAQWRRRARHGAPHARASHTLATRGAARPPPDGASARHPRSAQVTHVSDDGVIHAGGTKDGS